MPVMSVSHFLAETIIYCMKLTAVVGKAKLPNALLALFTTALHPYG
jgi:hypothetical protein